MKEDELFLPINSKLKSIVDTSCLLPALSYWQQKRKEIRANFILMCSFFILLVLVLLAILGPYLSTYTYDKINLALKNRPPSFQFWFGTDELGRDLFTRCCWGARISIVVSVAASLIDLIVGVVYGMIAGYSHAKLDEWMMRLIDILQSIPYLLIVILLVVIMGPGLGTIILALAMTGWINMARIVRSQILQLKNREFILAARFYGASTSRILIKHLFPNILGSIIVVLTATIPTALFTEAFLSFLGLGVQAPIASWGTLANEGLVALKYYPWRLFFPSLLICLTIVSLNLAGDELRKLFDKELKQ